MARILKYRTRSSGHRNLHGPRLRKRRRIVDGKLIEERIRIEAPEAFDEAHVLAGASESRLVGEIRRLEDQGIALPMAARVPLPLADMLWQMRTPVDGDDTGLMSHLDENHDVS